MSSGVWEGNEGGLGWKRCPPEDPGHHSVLATVTRADVIPLAEHRLSLGKMSAELGSSLRSQCAL